MPKIVSHKCLPKTPFGSQRQLGGGVADEISGVAGDLFGVADEILGGSLTKFLAIFPGVADEILGSPTICSGVADEISDKMAGRR